MATTIRSLAVAGLGAALLTASAAVAGPACATPMPNPGGIGAPAAAMTNNTYEPEVNIFEVASNHHVVVWHLAGMAGNEATWRTDLGGYATGGVSMAASSVFVRGADGAAWYYNGQGWRFLGGRIIGYPSAVATSDETHGRVVIVMVRGVNGAMYERVWTAVGWSPAWQRVGGALTSSPSVAATSAGILVYALGRDGQMWSSTRGSGLQGQWSGWRQVIWRDRFGHAIRPGFEATVNEAEGNVWVHVVDVNGVWWIALRGSIGASRSSVSAYFISPVVVVSQSFQENLDPPWWYTLEVGRGLNGRLYYNSSIDNNSWLPVGAV
jgi:hypothetical protein